MAIKGLDKLTRELKDAGKALAEMDGEFGSISFDPHDPASIDAATQEVDRLIDERMGQHASDSFAGSIAEQMKESFREGLLEQAAAARLGKDEGEPDDGN